MNYFPPRFLPFAVLCLFLLHSGGFRREMDTPRLMLTGTGSYSSAGFDTFHFRSQLEAGFYHLFNKVNMNIPRYVDPSINYGVDVCSLFENTGLEPLIMSRGSFSTAYVRLFYCNMEPGGSLAARSFMAGREVVITVTDVANTFGVPADGADLWALTDRERADEWMTINHELSGARGGRRHNPNVRDYKRDAYLVQFALRHGLFQKAGDKAHINAPLALATYYCLRKIRFNVAEAVLRSICALSDIRTSRAPPNLAYGHIIQAVLVRKYDLSPGAADDAILRPLLRKSIQFALKPFNADGSRSGDVLGGGEEEAHGDDVPQGGDGPTEGGSSQEGGGEAVPGYHRLLEGRVAQLERERSVSTTDLRRMEERLLAASQTGHSRTQGRLHRLKKEVRGYFCCLAPAEGSRRRDSSSSNDAMDAADS